jgi:hypothetical protein
MGCEVGRAFAWERSHGCRMGAAAWLSHGARAWLSHGMAARAFARTGLLDLTVRCTVMKLEHHKLLQRAYGFAKGKDKALGPLGASELAELAAAGWPVGVPVTLSHDEVVDRLRRAAALFDVKTIADAFVAGLGSAPRGRQPLISYAFARHLAMHEGVYEANYSACRACGIDRSTTLDPSKELLLYYSGNVWNERPGRWCIELEELARSGAPQPTQEDRHTLLALLRACDASDAAITPGQLEQQLAKDKILRTTKTKYERYGILQALAETGILPNELIAPRWDRFITPAEIWRASENLKGSPRSDVVLPLAAWRGRLGVDWQRAAEIFSIAPGGGP